MRIVLFFIVPAFTASFDCNICGPTMMMGNEDGIIEIPGRENRTCRELQDIADSGVITEEQCTELNPIVQEPCDCSGFVCNICGDGGVSTDPEGLIDIPGDDEGLTTCAAVNEVAKAGGFNESTCSTVQAIAEDPCGCTQGSIVPTISPSSPTDSGSDFRPDRSPTLAPRPTRSPTPGPTTEPTSPDFSAATKIPCILVSISMLVAASLIQV